MKEEIKVHDIYYWILSIIIIFYSGSAVSVISSTYRNGIVFVAVFFLVLRLIERRFTVSKSLRTMFLLYFSFMIMITAVSTAFSTFYLRLFATVYIAYEISERIDCEKFIAFYGRLMSYITVVALAGYFLVNGLGLVSEFPRFVNFNGEAYRGIIFFNFIERLPERNCALFWEPGLFATALTFALIFELIYQEKKSFFRIILFLIGILTANSTAGYVMLLLLFVLFSTKFQPKQKSVRILLSVVQILIVIAAIVVFLNLDKILIASGLYKNTMFAKLISNTFLESQRGQAIQDSFASFMQSPLFGSGAEQIIQGMNYVADTATSVYALSIFGFLGVGYSVFYFTGVLKQKNLSLIVRIVFLVILLGILNKEPHLDLLFTWILGFFLLKKAQVDDKKSFIAKKAIN